MNDYHLKKLRKMLQQVDPSAKSEGLLKSIKKSKKGVTNELLQKGIPGSSAPALEVVSESLDRFSQDKKLNRDQKFALEAIVMPFHRPVIDIVNNKMKASQLTPKWQHLKDKTKLKSRIESTLLSVGRIELPQHSSLPYAGTGFVVGDGLLMTNRHVAGIFTDGVGQKQIDFKVGQTAAVDFLQEVDSKRTDSLSVEDVLLIHPYWDMAILKVKGLPKERKALKLSRTDPATLKDREVVVIGYPGYDPSGDSIYQDMQGRIFRSKYYVKRLQPGNLRIRDDVDSFGKSVPAITHDCSTLGGNSGSAVIDLETGEVIGLHFAGAYLVANYAVPTFDLASDNRVVDAGVNFSGSNVPESSAYDKYWDAADSNVQAEQRTAPQTTTAQSAGNSIPTSSNNQIGLQSNSGIRLTIPLNISIDFGQPEIVQSQPVVPTKAEGLFGPPPRTFNLSELERMFSADSLTSTSFDWRTALSLACASKFAYESAAIVEASGVQDWGFDTCRFVESGETQAFVASTSDSILVSFRGTESLGDWIQNIRMLPTETSIGSIHTGFLRGFDGVQSELENIVGDFSSRPVVVTGHSLGGALATIAAAKWKDTFPVSTVYTFGQPAVGNSDFKSFMEQNYPNKIFRFVNDDDIVPKLPPGYDHLGRLILFGPRVEQPLLESLGASGTDRVLSDSEFESLVQQLKSAKRKSRLESLSASPTEEGLLPSFSDHKSDRYIEKILARVGTT